jgi:ribonuclease-3
MTEVRISLIRRETLAQLALELDLGSHLLMSNGEEASGGRTKHSNLANVFEALIGAIYLDQGIEILREFINSIFDPYFNTLPDSAAVTNFKSRLQEFSQSEFKQLPCYRLIETAGPDHNKLFTVEVLLNNKVLGTGCGKNKRVAEMEAARVACDVLKC